MRLKFVSLIMLGMLVFVGGCQMDNEEPKAKMNEKQEQKKLEDMKEEDLPDVRAFQNEFTRGFLQSTEETRPGYYSFLSGTGAFEMDFPEEGKIGEKSYNLKDNSYEGVTIGVGNEQSEIAHTIKIRYYDDLSHEHKKSRLSQMKSNIGMDLEFEEKSNENHTLYITSYQHERDEYDDDVYGFAGLMLNNKSLGGIQVIYTSYCKENCSELKEDDMKKAQKMIESIRFLDVSKDDENE